MTDFFVTLQGIDHASARQSFLSRLKNVFIIEKLYNKTGVALLVVFALIIAAGTAYKGVIFGAILVGVLCAFPLLYSIVTYPKFGIIILLVMAYMLWQVADYIPIPIGTAMDGLQGLLLLGYLYIPKKTKMVTF
ncbi:hypothetical protein HH214_01070 [Mucilaginibacter robiniae]|uniref:Uncharacterized protein n=1 Tax=Mucilaginibacter robiniae TaxID=2728022 RepID=A0A7L5E160_9SPHI|nr:hypothetical protein [Mucilaginibacter robiniae]QJD94563.1 hypothetical protein HH214_01070 [Mucilaginibacter robiniae]